MGVTATDNGYVIKVTGTTNTADVVTAAFIRLAGILWYKPTVVGHLLNFTDTAGNDILPCYCDVADSSKWYDLEDWPVNGLKIDDMDSGTVMIYLKRGRA